MHEDGATGVTVGSAAAAVEDLVDGFSHELALYRGTGELLAAVLPFVLEGIARREPVMVAMVPRRLDLLEQALGADATRVDFVDMAELGANPACIIPEWRRFLEDTSDVGPVRGVAEPVWRGRREVELDEAELHESLLNLAFDGGPPWRLLCSYDAAVLSDDVLRDALANHPRVHTVQRPGPPDQVGYLGHQHAFERFTEPLPDPPPRATRVAFRDGDLGALRRRIRDLADGAGLERPARDNLVLAMHELAVNSIVHAAGGGTLSFWREPDALVVEVRDRGRIDDALVGRGSLDLDAESGRGVWMANQLCDLVQVRSGESGTQVRLWTWLDSPVA